MNIYDIAKEAGVSVATVSRVLNKNTKVKAETREKVMKVMEGGKYVPNMVARNLSIGDSQNIAFLVPDVENPFFSKILHGISEIANKYNYNVFMFGTDEDVQKEHKALENIKMQMIKGIIIIPVNEGDRETLQKLKNFEERGIPVVLVDRDLKNSNFDGVFSEDIDGAYEAVNCLIQAGHRKIGIISGPATSKPGYERLKGYKKALKKHRIAINEDYVVDGKFKEEDAYLAMRNLMNLSDPPTAIFSVNNLTTLGILKYINEYNLIIGKDICLVAFDDIKELAYTNVQLTVVTRPVFEMGCEAMEILEKRFTEKKTGNTMNLIIYRTSVKTWLLKRGSEKNIKYEKDN